MPRFVGVQIDGVITTHLPNWNQSYATLCGLDGDDPRSGQNPAAPGNKADCIDCRAIFDLCRKFRMTDFAGEEERS